MKASVRVAALALLPLMATIPTPTAAGSPGAGSHPRASSGAVAALAGAALAPAPPAGAATRKAGVLGAAWATYKARFVTPEGRVVDDANGGVSHSEGQGYAMLLAVAADDGLAFARIWGWTARELYRRPDGLASWRWVPAASPHVTDPNNATDGDLLIAWALLRASHRWTSPEYADAARRIAVAVGRHATFDSRLGRALKPGAQGFDAAGTVDGPVVNPSYWVFPALAALPEVAPEIDWAAITRTGLSLIAAARFGPVDLPSDWVSLKGAPLPAKGFPREFGYNAVRIPLYLVWGGVDTPALLEPFLRLARQGAVPTVVDVTTGLPGDTLGDPGYRAIFALAACAAARAKDPAMAVAAGTPARVPATLAGPPDDEHYYPASLNLLSALAAEDRGLRCD